MISANRHLGVSASVLLVLLGLSACQAFAPACTQDLRPGISLTLLASATAGSIDTDSVLAIAVEGAYADTVGGNPPDDRIPKLGLAYERAGTYRVEVKARGYEDWSRSGIRVLAEGCHVRTTEVIALLRR